jgi:hypothetical protein
VVKDEGAERFEVVLCTSWRVRPSALWLLEEKHLSELPPSVKYFLKTSCVFYALQLYDTLFANAIEDGELLKHVHHSRVSHEAQITLNSRT